VIGLLKILLIVAASLVGLVVFALSVLVLFFFPEWVRWTAGGITVFVAAWFFLFGRFRRKSGLLINDGTVYDRWRSPSKARKDFL
jgi:hypothetical protein